VQRQRREWSRRCCPSLANSIFAETAQGLSRRPATSSGCELLIASTGYSLEREEHQLRALLGWHPSGRGRHGPAPFARAR
jgi:LacI family gluconate utilization system Gnt-I transcriptional repressor